MKVTVNQETCIGCEMCVAVSDELFKMNEDGKSECCFEEVSPESESKAVEACNVCPVRAIEIQ